MRLWEAARELGVSVRTVRSWCQTGKIKAEKADFPIPHWRIKFIPKKKVKKQSWMVIR